MNLHITYVTLETLLYVTFVTYKVKIIFKNLQLSLEITRKRLVLLYSAFYILYSYKLL